MEDFAPRCRCGCRCHSQLSHPICSAESKDGAKGCGVSNVSSIMVPAAHGPAMPSHGGSCWIAMPAHHRPRRLADWINPTGARKVPLLVRHEWNSERHTGGEELGLASS